MFKNVLIANRGDQPLISGAAAKPNCMRVEDLAGDFDAVSSTCLVVELNHV
ncbi:hypothetical protein ZMTM_08750 [Methyloradius palustris]|uniref:Uncharacterized protein n=1 Tax=Methyloradius palustris TaxID=2778876 RepID=A0A8D5GAE9_9PROT|nr:hypothetical protein ZMTM_08750 [Methyloradius palustris]